MQSKNFKKIIIGTAQFGMSYGVSNKTGIPNQSELQSIINYCYENNIAYLDSANTYGDAEKRLGESGVGNFKIISKISVQKKLNSSSLLSFIEDSCERLKISRLEGLLLHSYNSSKEDDHLLSLLEEIKDSKLVKKIGASIYNFEDMIKINKTFKVDIFQIPLNILNRDYFLDKTLNDVRSNGVEIHIRSIFLQGLLLMNKDTRPSYFKKWEGLFDKWDSWLEEKKLTPLEVCLSFAFFHKNVDKVLIGIDSIKQLKEIVQIIKNLKNIDYPNGFISNDKNLIHPGNWII